jgi:hypothetical protein
LPIPSVISRAAEIVDQICISKLAVEDGKFWMSGGEPKNSWVNSIKYSGPKVLLCYGYVKISEG